MSRRDETREQRLRREADELAEKMETPEYLAKIVSMVKEKIRTDSPHLLNSNVEPNFNVFYMKENNWNHIKVPGGRGQNKNGCEEFSYGAAAAPPSKAESEVNEVPPGDKLLMEQSNLPLNLEDVAAFQIPPRTTQKE